MTALTIRPGLVGALFDPGAYAPDPPALWRARDSSERQQREFERTLCSLALMAWTWPIALVAGPMIAGGRR